MRLKSVADGKQVNILVLYITAMGGRRRLGQPEIGSLGLNVKVGDLGKSGSLLTLRRDDELRK